MYEIWVVVIIMLYTKEGVGSCNERFGIIAKVMDTFVLTDIVLMWTRVCNRIRANILLLLPTSQN